MRTFDEHFRAIEMDGFETESFDFGGDGHVDYYAVIELSPDDYQMFPDDIGTLDTHVVIHHDNQGFVDVSAVGHGDIVSLRSEFEAFCNEQENIADIEC